MIDWDAVAQEAATLLSNYLKIRSTNPPGDELAAAEFLAGELRQRNLQPEIFTPAPRRANLVARLSGNSSKQAILLYHHMDVVEADSTRWHSDPFGGEIREGCVWGRGAIDMKGMGVMQLLALDLLQRRHPQRSRPVIFYAAADEEEGGKFGSQWMLERHPDKIDSEYAWDEGAFGLRDFFGPQPFFPVAVTEKQDLWLKLNVQAEPGYSATPQGDSAIQILLQALQRIQRLNLPFELHPVTRRMMETASAGMGFPRSWLMKNLHHPLVLRLAQGALSQKASIAAMFRDTLSITSIHAGGKENVVPGTAEAILDVRLLPGKSPEAFVARLRRATRDERVHIELLRDPQPSPPSSMDTEFAQALTRTLRELVPGSLCAPFLTPGATDSCFFRRRGIHSYGLFPAILSPDDLAGFHGIDERISIENLRLGVQVIYTVLSRLAGVEDSPP